jgi:hypothetical protein
MNNIIYAYSSNSIDDAKILDTSLNRNINDHLYYILNGQLQDKLNDAIYRNLFNEIDIELNDEFDDELYLVLNENENE